MSGHHSQNRFQGIVALIAALGIAVACSPQASAKKERSTGASELNERVVETAGSTQIRAEIWVDNWFAFYVDGEKVAEDSVPITTERSFNAEKIMFSSDLPATVAFEFRDFMENETGLEYIGTGRQQLGDGGAIAQFYNVGSGELIASTNSRWRCKVIQRAPVDAACARERDPRIDEGVCAQKSEPSPAGWTSASFDDSDWPLASVHSATSVRPRGGYDQVIWNSAAKIIWGPDLERDNVVLCRATIGN